MVSGTYPRLVPYRGRFLDSSSGACINLCNLMYLLYLSKGSSCFCRETLRVTSRNLHHGTSHEKRAKHCEDVYESNERKTEFTAKLQKKKKTKERIGKESTKSWVHKGARVLVYCWRRTTTSGRQDIRERTGIFTGGRRGFAVRCERVRVREWEAFTDQQ